MTLRKECEHDPSLLRTYTNKGRPDTKCLACKAAYNQARYWRNRDQTTRDRNNRTRKHTQAAVRDADLALAELRVALEEYRRTM